ncbi:glycosyltransferase family 1 protein [Kocuria coralli]|uniref:D-inositol 3-phosphate glycosyltransferase n=1 Tax=Kocuria coralli TaxID=1461025 RepID=A0A5J5KW41_9MICC|nr:glycosyltransferase family 1 protein [Kocuria coralli]KAA9393967.1 glycosyltransferase family 1 protein [Kocuria coralli]
MRIALYSEVFLPKIDGVVTRILRTLEQLNELGHEAVVFAPGNPPSSYAGHAVVPVRSVSFKPWYPEIKLGLPTARIATNMAHFRPDIVHAVNPIWLAAYGVLSARRRDLPLLSSFHTDVPHYADALGLHLLRHPSEHWLRWLHNQSEVNLCTSGPMVERARAVGVRDVDLWPKAVDTGGYHPSMADRALRSRLTGGHPEDPLIVYVGRVSKEKNLDQLIEPMRRLPQARLAIVGSGPHREQLERQFAGTNTVFTGYMSGPDLASAYASADVFAFPSQSETLGLVALEAFASGLPVVGARAGGIPYVVDHGETGFLVEPGSADDLTRRLGELVDDPQLRARMAAAARQEALRHSWRASTDKLVEYYRLALERHEHRHVPPGPFLKTFGAAEYRTLKLPRRRRRG